MAARPESVEQERDRLRLELKNERADCAICVEALEHIAGDVEPNHAGSCDCPACTAYSALARLEARS